MNDRLSTLLAPFLDCTYADVRYEERRITEITADAHAIRPRECLDAGFHLREYRDGKWRSHVFTDPERFSSGEDARVVCVPHMTCRPAVPSPQRELAGPEDLSDTRLETLSCNTKAAMLCTYVAEIVSFTGVRNFLIQYRDEYARKHMLNCRGEYIAQDSTRGICIVTIGIENGRGTHAATTVLTSNGTCGDILCRREEIANLLRFLSEPKARCFPGEGLVTVVADAQLAGSLIHETVGHTLEADFTPTTPQLHALINVEKDLHNPALTVVDNPTLECKAGHYLYDDEGVKGRETILVEQGLIKGRLHSLATSFEQGVHSTGNGRAVSHRFPPIVRMSNIVACEGPHSLEDMIGSTKRGYFLQGLGGGQVTGDTMYYRVNGGRAIENGKLGSAVGSVLIESPITHFLRNIDMVGNTLHSGPASFCVKNRQSYLPLWSGAPCLKINNIRLRALPE